MTTAASQSRFRQSHTGLRIKDPASQQNYLQSKLLQGLQQRMHQEEDVQLAYGRPNRPSTPIRTVVNGVYGTVATFEITERSKGIESTKRFEKNMRPSRGHTRASTMAQDQVLRNTLAAGVERKESAASLFKLKKFQQVNSRVGQHHKNEPHRKSRQSCDLRPTQTLR